MTVDLFKATEAVKDIGFTIDCELNFPKHVKSIIERFVSLLRVLNRFRRLLPEDVKLKIVRPLVMPIIH